MEGKLLADESTPHNKKNTEIFYECFPFYLSIGMTSAEYWEGDCSLTQYYRKSYEMKQEINNQKAWLQGMYFYDAINSTILSLINKDKKITYPEKPYALNKEELEKQKELKAKEAEAQAAYWMHTLVNNSQEDKNSATVPLENK